MVEIHLATDGWAQVFLAVEMLRSIGESFRMALESQHGIVIPVSFGTLQRKVSKVPPKKAAPRESEGGIFTAAPIEAPSVEASKSHIGDVLLSAVKTKLAGLNPMHRLHFNHRRNRSAGSQSMAKMAYSKDTDKAGRWAASSDVWRSWLVAM